MDGMRRLKSAPGNGAGGSGAYLFHRVARFPSDLRSHVQRIYLHLAEENGMDTYAALVDLFVSLGAKGRELRQRMLRQSWPVLTAEQRDILTRYLESGLDRLDHTPPAPGSALLLGVGGTRHLVEKTGYSSTASRDVMQQVDELLEYGQLEEARGLLEESLLQYPLRSELHEQLLDIYERSRDFARFNSMRLRLSELNHVCRDRWRSLDTKFAALKDPVNSPVRNLSVE